MNKKLPKLIIVILTYNSWKDTLKLIKSLKIKEIKKTLNVSIYVCDNGSNNARKDIAKKYDIEYIRFVKNKGISGAWNECIRRLANENSHFLIISNDLIFPNYSTLQINKIILELENNQKIGAISPTLYRDRELRLIDTSGLFFSKEGSIKKIRTKVNKPIALDSSIIFFNKSIFKEENNINELFNRLYLNFGGDFDLSLKLISQGFELLVNNQFPIHHVGATGNKKISKFTLYNSIKNQYAYIYSYLPANVIKKNIWYLFIGLIKNIILILLNFDILLIKSLILFFITNKKYLISYRNNNIKNTKIQKHLKYLY